VSTTEEELESEEQAAAPDGDDATPPEDVPTEPGETGGAGGEPPTGPPLELGAGAGLPDPVRDRLLLPLLLPLAAMAAIALYVLNVSRVFLAGGDGAASVVTAVLVTLGILGGAAVISASPRLRSSTLTMTVAMLLVAVVSAGLITLGPSEDKGKGAGAAYKQPKGPPTATLEVDALPSLSFQSDEFTVPGGILEINYVDKGGSHTLVFEEQDFAGFQLAVPDGPKKGKVEIKEGEYTIYCSIPGHRAAGMEAKVVITPPPAG